MRMVGDASKANAFMVVFKSGAGLAMTALASFGALAPRLGMDVTTLNGGLAAALGAAVGIVLALHG